MLNIEAQRPDRGPQDALTAMICIAGFGDDRSMFEPLLDTPLAHSFRIVPIDLPGFGAAPPNGRATLAELARYVDDRARAEGALIILAHSAASIIASLAALRPGATLDTVISLEGNLTADDAYFSGTAADYDDAIEFREAFLARLDEMAATQPLVRRYRSIVATADPKALWELGCDARQFSSEQVPGELLLQVPNGWYLYNPANCPAATLAWLNTHPLRRLTLENASHWKSVDQPGQLAEKILEALAFQ